VAADLEARWEEALRLREQLRHDGEQRQRQQEPLLSDAENYSRVGAAALGHRRPSMSALRAASAAAHAVARALAPAAHAQRLANAPSRRRYLMNVVAGLSQVDGQDRSHRSGDAMRAEVGKCVANVLLDQARRPGTDDTILLQAAWSSRPWSSASIQPTRACKQSP
jgi:hypothetical protein